MLLFQSELMLVMPIIPRALPWAKISCTFSAKKLTCGQSENLENRKKKRIEKP
jgi:hypothetical protein